MTICVTGSSLGAKHGKTVQDEDDSGPQWHSGWDHASPAAIPIAK